PAETLSAPLKSRITAARNDIDIRIQFRLFVQKSEKGTWIAVYWNTREPLVLLESDHRKMSIRGEVEVSGKPENTIVNFYGNGLHCPPKLDKPGRRFKHS